MSVINPTLIPYFEAAPSGPPSTAIFAGNEAAINTHYDILSFSSLGNAAAGVSIGTGNYVCGLSSSGSRAVFGCIDYTTDYKYISFSSYGAALNFGDMTTAVKNGAGCSDSTRGLYCGGQVSFASSRIDTIQYITIATASNATVFGSLTSTRAGCAGTQSETKAFIVAGRTAANVQQKSIEYVTIQSLGNAVFWGNLSQSLNRPASLSDLNRAIIAGGYAATTNTTKIEYFSTASAGNSSNFGNIITARRDTTGCSNLTYGLIAGGTGANTLNDIEYITISSLGNASAWGYLSTGRTELGSCTGTG